MIFGFFAHYPLAKEHEKHFSRLQLTPIHVPYYIPYNIFYFRIGLGQKDTTLNDTVFSMFLNKKVRIQCLQEKCG